MRRSARRLIVLPYRPQLFPHESYPPWQALKRVFERLEATLRTRAMPTSFKYLEVALVQAAQRMFVVARGDLPPERWHRRALATIAKLERGKMAIVDYVVTETLDLDEAQALVDALDDTIDRLRDEIERVIRSVSERSTGDGDDPSRVIH